jgi:superfamily II DNA or RNA helicase
MILTEGYDLPSLGCIVLARPTKQIGLFRQMSGRGLRPAPDKQNLILIDHSGAVYRHGLLEDRIEWTLSITEHAENPTHAKRTRDTMRKLIACSQCNALRVADDKCPHCGFLPQRADGIHFRDGELGRVDRNDPIVRLRWHAMLTHVAIARDYKLGWVSHKYREKFGTWPPVREVAPLPPSPEVLAWVHRRSVA